jgi:hypothetical protein
VPTPTPPAPSAPPVPTPTPVPSAAAIPVPTAPAPSAPPTSPVPPTSTLKDRVIKPLNDPLTSPVNIDELLDKEIAKEAGISEDARPTIATTTQEKAIVNEQLNEFAASDDGTAEVEIGPDGSLKTAEPKAEPEAKTEEDSKPAPDVSAQTPPPPPPPPAPTAPTPPAAA